MTCLYSDGQYLYAGGWHTGVFRTTDAAQWREFNAGLTGYRDVMTITGDGRALFAGTFHGEVFAWAGDKWTLRHDFGDGPPAVVRVLLPWRGGLLAGVGSGVYFSRDGGHTWTQLWAGQDVSCLAPSPFRDQSFFFGTLGHGLGACGPDGRDCAILASYSAGKTIDALAPDAASHVLYVAAEGDGVWTTTDGRSFSSIRLHPTSAETYPIALYLRGKTLVISLDGAGVLFKDLTSNRWPIKLPFPIAITAVTEHRGRLFYGTDGVGVFGETEHGFAPVDTGLLNYPSSIVEETLRAASQRRGR
jgi:hypothetical protein